MTHFIILIVSCTNETVVHSNLNIVNMVAYSNPFYGTSTSHLARKFIGSHDIMLSYEL